MTLIFLDNLAPKPILVLLLGLLVAGCTASRPPTEYLAAAEKAVMKAEHDGAADYAPLELREARDKLEAVRAAVEAADGRQAALLAEKCMVDAELASEKARTAAVRERAQRLRESIKVLNEEIEAAETDDA